MSEKKLLPGFPKAEKASVHTLKYKFDWNDKQLEWLEKNWIKIGEDMNMPLYVRPDVMNKVSIHY